jgi:PTS system N-acetylglucosamine-specific IIC component
LIRPAPGALQVVVGPIADDVASEMRAAAGPLRAVPVVQAKAAPVSTLDVAPWFAALGGKGNVTAAGSASSRVWIDLVDADAIDEGGLKALGVRMVLRGPRGLQLIVGPLAPVLASGLSEAA